MFIDFKGSLQINPLTRKATSVRTR